MPAVDVRRRVCARSVCHIPEIALQVRLLQVLSILRLYALLLPVT